MLNFIKKEPVLFAASAAAAISMIIVPPDAMYRGYFNIRVLCLLFSFMAIVAGLRQIGVFDIIARVLIAGCKNLRLLALVLTALCFFSSMLITNDVALLTFVPLTIGVLKKAKGEKYIAYIVVLQTVAANMGSMLTPMGNPQNLYLSDFYTISPLSFFSATSPICLASGIILLSLIFFVKKIKFSQINDDIPSINKKGLLYMYAILGIIAVLSVFNIINYYALTLLTALLCLVFDRRIYKQTDWCLLLTFIMFFVFVGNIARIEGIKSALNSITYGRELIIGAAVSQIISNVPAAVMLSTFTDNGIALMLGTDIGGLGTPVASLASLISYKLYAQCGENCGKYMRLFLSINIGMLILLIGFGEIVLKLSEK